MNTPPNFDINAIRQAAGAGDSDAQYMLAALLSNAGNREEADRWLNASAGQGNGEALYTLATREFKSSEALENAYELLQRGSAGGSLAAKRLLGVVYAEGYGVAPDWSLAVSFIADAAREGHAGAMMELALLLFAQDPDDIDGAALIATASTRSVSAAAVMIRRTALGRSYTDMAHAEKALRQLAIEGYRNSTALDAALGAQTEREIYHGGDVDWGRVLEKCSNLPSAPRIEPELVCDHPSIRVYRDAFSKEECEYVIATAMPHLAPSLIVDPTTGQARRDEYRSSLTAVLGPVDLDLATVMLNRRIAEFAGQPAENGEFLGVLCYSPGQEYKPHYDWLPDGAELDRSGQRIGTALMYLNSEYDDGETHFLTPDIKFKGEAGDLLVFDNVLVDGATDDASQHAGLPVANGLKWLGSRWFREKKYNF